MTIAFPPSIGISFLFMGITKDLHTITRSTVPLLSWCRDHVSCSSSREGAGAASRSQGPPHGASGQRHTRFGRAPVHIAGVSASDRSSGVVAPHADVSRTAR